MPQLNPNPWFFMMLTTWVIFSLILQPKLLPLTSTNRPSNKTQTPNKTVPWPWPWT
uniref:ATP synthase complex subunit 8 n=1 Tax=Caracara plancus cheriway TaxID=1094199 RepID=A0A5B9R8U3_CARPF|nr:ATP synthase F0 subunit 8 [Caracara cheriway]QEG56911.1 ATP synthase F0 subunit 8 [Caracara cheriway]